MNTACNSYSNVTYLVSYRPPPTVEEGDIARLFSGPRTDVRGENDYRPSKTIDNGQAFSQEEIIYLFF